MNIYQQLLTELGRNTVIRAEVTDRIPKDIDPGIFSMIQKKSAYGWYDRSKDRVVLYSPNLSSNTDHILSCAVFLYIRENGLKSLLDGQYDNFCREVAGWYYHGSKSQDKAVLREMTESYLNELSVNDKASWRKVASVVSKYAGIEFNDFVAMAVINGNRAHEGRVVRKALENNEHSVIDSQIRNKINRVYGNDIIELGRSSDALLRVGYPDTSVSIRSTAVRDFLRNSRIFEDESFCLSDKFADPMVILKGKRSENSGRLESCFIVTNHFVRGKGFLSFGIDSPDSLLSGYSNGKNSIKVRSCIFMSEYGLLCALHVGNGSNIMYLKFGRNSGYEVSDYLKQMEGRDSKQLGSHKKSDDRPALVEGPSLVSRRLVTVANIVNDFRNPMDSRKRKSIFGSYLFEENINKRLEIVNEMKSVAKEVTGYRATSVPSTTKDAKHIYLTEKDFSTAYIRKFSKAGIDTAFRLMTYGKERFITDFGKRAFRKAVEFLDKHDLSFMNHVVIKKIDESEFIGKNPQEKINIVRKDMYNAFSGLKDEHVSKTVRFPRRLDGSYIHNSGSYMLIAKSLSMARWRDCNVFLTKDEAASFDIALTGTAVPTYVFDKGEFNVYYNLAETSFAVQKTESFDALKQDSCRRTPEVDPFVKAYINLLSGGEKNERKLDVYDISLIDAAYQRQYRRSGGLENDGGFVHHIRPELPERRTLSRSTEIDSEDRPKKKRGRPPKKGTGIRR